MSRCATRDNNTGGKSTSGVVDTGGKFTGDGGNFVSGVNDTGGTWPLVSTSPAVNLPPVSMTPIWIVTTISDCPHLRLNYI